MTGGEIKQSLDFWAPLWRPFFGEDIGGWAVFGGVKWRCVNYNFSTAGSGRQGSENAGYFTGPDLKFAIIALL